MMAVKVIIAPLSTTTITANDLIKHSLPRRLISVGALFGLSFLLNLYLFANMEERARSDDIATTVWTAIFLALVPIFLEIFYMLFNDAYRTSLPNVQPPPPPQKFPSPPPIASPAIQQAAVCSMHSFNK